MIKTLLVVILIVIIAFLSCRTETIKNLIIFIAIVALSAVLLGIIFGVSFYPITVLLIYVGAIVVSTLMVILTFDLRSEYNKTRFHAKFIPALITHAALSSIIFFVVEIYSNYSEKYWHVAELDHIALYNKCLADTKFTKSFCDEQFGFINRDKGLYDILTNSTNDLSVISSNFYSSYSVLFLILTTLLTLSLIAALAIVKKGGK